MKLPTPARVISDRRLVDVALNNLQRTYNTMRIKDTIHEVAWGMHHFGSVSTGGELRMRDIRAAVSKGLVKSIGEAALCDGDGFIIQPERYRESFILTEEGLKKFREICPKTAEEWNLESSK